jgi:hypothetical protein
MSDWLYNLPVPWMARLRDLIRGYIEQAATGAASANHAGRVNEPVSRAGTRA